MRRGRYVVLPLLVAVILLAIPAPMVRAGSAPSPTAPSPALVTDAVAIPLGVRAVPLDPATPLQLEITLSLPNASALSQFLVAVEDPASPLYEQFLTHAEFESRFAPSPSAVAAVVASLRSSGATAVTVAPDRLSAIATMSAGDAERLLGVRMVSYDSENGRSVYTALGDPSLPEGLSGRVSAITGLSNADNRPIVDNLRAGPVSAVRSPSRVDQFALGNNTTGDQWFVGSDFTNAFQAADLLPGSSSIANATYPANVAIATLLASGYNMTLGRDTPPWDPLVVHTYFNYTLSPTWAAIETAAPLVGVPVTIFGATPPLPGSFDGVNDSLEDEFENSLDLEMAGSLAPGAPLYNFYFSGSLIENASSDAELASYFDEDLASALSYNYGTATLGAVSLSFGLADLNDPTWNVELQEAAAMGVTIVAATGDQGNAPESVTQNTVGQWPLWPATATFNTTGALAVGGVSLEMGGTPNGWFNGTTLWIEYDGNTTGLATLSAWWDARLPAGSEGGVSTVYSEPYWQFHSAAQSNIVNATVRQGVSSLGRSEPDVAFPANSTIAFVVADTEGNVYFTLLEGTSVAAPSIAGLIADEVAVAHHSFGFIDPELYRIASYYEAHPGPGDPYYSVTNGSNYVFSATPGWNAVTGWGAPIGPLLYYADATPAVRNYVYAGPTPALPATAPAPAVPWLEIGLIAVAGIVVAVVLILVVSRSRSSRTAPPMVPYGVVPPPPPGAATSWAPPPPPGAVAPPPPPPPAGMPPPPPPESSMAGVPTAPGGPAMFLCPYCGSPRPAEPVRCPRCGAY